MSNSEQNGKVGRSLDLLHEKQDSQTLALTEVKEELATQKAILSIYTKQQDQINFALTEVNERLSEYNHQLKVHIQGVQELKTQNQLIREENALREKEWSQRLDIAEKPIKWIQTTGVFIKWIGAISAAILSVAALVKFFGIM
jgi:hypothetical protein